jgi:hypothetical protein
MASTGNLSEQFKVIRAGLDIHIHRILGDFAEEVKNKVGQDMVHSDKSVSGDGLSSSLKFKQIGTAENIQKIKDEIAMKMRNLSIDGLKKE